MNELMTPKEISLELAKRIKTIRLQLNMSQIEIAKKCGIDVKTYQSFEYEGKGSFINFIKIVQKLGKVLELDALLKDEPILPKNKILNKIKPIRKRASNRSTSKKKLSSDSSQVSNLNNYLLTLKGKNEK